MANPQITWTTPTTGLLPNDLYTITAKFGSEGTLAPGGDNASLSGEYSSDIYALVRTHNNGQSYLGESDPGGPRPYIPQHYVYTTEPQQGQISLKGGVYELLPYSCGQIVSVSGYILLEDGGHVESENEDFFITGEGDDSSGGGAGTRLYTDFAGIGHSPTEPYSTYPASSSDVAGPLLCGSYTNVESQHTYTLATFSSDTA